MWMETHVSFWMDTASMTPALSRIIILTDNLLRKILHKDCTYDNPRYYNITNSCGKAIEKTSIVGWVRWNFEILVLQYMGQKSM